MPKPDVSVVIPAFNDATYLERLLKDLTKQKFEQFEVVVSDAQSKDGTKELVDSFKNQLDIKLVESPPTGPGAGRNAGAKQASGQWLLFLDADDHIDDPDFINTLIKESENHGWQTATAKIRHQGASALETFGSGLNYRYIKLLARTKHPVAPGWCILTKRQLFESLSGFNPKIQFGEDYDYVSRAGHAGFGFVEKTYYYVDLRRPRTEGWRLTVKAVANEIYRHTHHYNLENNPIAYKFGMHKKRSDS